MGRINRIFSIAGLLSLLSYLPASLGAIAAERPSICVTNKSGDVFTNLLVSKVLGDGLLLENSAGQFKVKYTDLPAEVREKYKTSAVAAAQKEQREAEANARFVANQQNFQAERARLHKAREQKAAVAPASAARNLKIEIPNQGWSIGILNCGFGRLAKESNGGQFICRGMAENGLNLSIFVESPHGSGMGTEDVYQYYWPKASRNPLLDAQSVRMEKEERFVKVTYTTLDMPNVNFYFAHKGKWVDVHISKLSDAKTADKIFADFQSQLSYGD